jgi:hypothetical protein
MLGRKKGGQPGNQNAVTHGRHSAPRRAERRAAEEERQRKHGEWMATIPATDYGAIVDRLRRPKEQSAPRAAAGETFH